MNYAYYIFDLIPSAFTRCISSLAYFFQWMFTDYDFGVIQGSSVSMSPFEAMFGVGIIAFAGYTIAKWVLPFL